MNKIVSEFLRVPVVRAACALALTSVPRTHGLVGSVRPPARDSFVAFVKTLSSIDPDAPTKCRGWTVHELTAHLAAGSAEIADVIELELSGAPARPTRGFEEREAPYRALSSVHLRRAFFEQSFRAVAAIQRLLDAGESRQVAFTGVLWNAQSLVLHVESELVLHRWDIVGEDATSVAALSDSRYAVHAVTTVAAATPNVFPQRGGQPRTIILRAAGGPDIAVGGGPTTTVGLASVDHSLPVVECHPAVRTLMLWGRSPGPALPQPVGDPEAVDAVTEMLMPAPAMTA